MRRRRTGFSLVELVVVIMILGILAAVAAPRLLQTSSTATDNGLRQSLGVVRNAIELYAAENAGGYPRTDTAANFKTDLAPYLRKFPAVPVGPAADDPAQAVDIKFGTGTTGDAAPTQGWYFNTSTGEFFVNFNGASGDGTTYDKF
jgi:general secretion pathway protein G